MLAAKPGARKPPVRLGIIPPIWAVRSSASPLPERASPSSHRIPACHGAAAHRPARRPSNAACPRYVRPRFGRPRRMTATGMQGKDTRFRVRETPEWKKHAADLEAEMLKRGMMFDVIDWSEDQGSLPFER